MPTTNLNTVSLHYKITAPQGKMTDRPDKIADRLSKMAPGHEKITNGVDKITPGHKKIIPGRVKMAHRHAKIIAGQAKIIHRQSESTSQHLRIIDLPTNQFLTKPHMIMKNQTIDGKLLFAQNAITNAMNTPEISDSLAVFGYDQNMLTQGQALYSAASGLHEKQGKEYGEQFAATDALTLAKALANKNYMVHIKIARVALRGDRGAAASLELAGERKESLSGWLKQAKAFYANALSTPSVLEALGRFGITTEKLQAGQTLVLDVETKFNTQLKETGEAQVATQQRDEALDDLQEWMSDFTAISRIALEGESQYLEVLGIVEPS